MSLGGPSAAANRSMDGVLSAAQKVRGGG